MTGAHLLSLRRISSTIANQLLKEQHQLQNVFPHYFEKYQTDGVEYNMYIGASMVKGREFNPVYLRNLRLHQLIFACDIARKIHMTTCPRLSQAGGSELESALG